MEVSLKDLLEAGVHYGHQTSRWNPKMRSSIYGIRDGIHIIDLQKTQKVLTQALGYIEDLVSKGGQVLFVGTKKAAQGFVESEASRCGMFYIQNRWLGGTLTNLSTVRTSIKKLKQIEKMKEDGSIENLTKKEASQKEKQLEKLIKSIGGIKDMVGQPSVLFVVDAKKEQTAILEAHRLNIPVVAITDTNCDPEGIKYAIPGNDDSLSAVKLYTSLVADACLSGKSKRQADIVTDDGEQAVVEGSHIKVRRLKQKDSVEGNWNNDTSNA